MRNTRHSTVSMIFSKNIIEIIKKKQALGKKMMSMRPACAKTETLPLNNTKESEA